MSKVPARSTRIYLDAIPVYGSLNSSSQEVTQNTPTSECFGDNGPKRSAAGPYDVSHDDMGFLEPEAPDPDNGFVGTDLEVWNRMFLESSEDDEDEDHYLGKFFAGGTEGNIAYESVIRIQGVPRSASLGGMVMMGFKSVGAGEMFRGYILRNATVTGAGNGTGVDAGVTQIGETYRAIFRLVSFTGTDITMKLQQSSDNGAGDAYADIAGLTSGALTETGIVVAETTNETERYKRVVVSGTFTSAVIVVTAGKLVEYS